MIDFDQKDGSGEKFTGTWDGDGILFPDGNKWLRKELSTIPQARSIHWSPYDRVGVVNADP